MLCKTPAKSAKKCAALLVRKFDEQVLAVSNGRDQKTTRREAVMVQLVDQLFVTGLFATKILTVVLKELQKKIG